MNSVWKIMVVIVTGTGIFISCRTEKEPDLNFSRTEFTDEELLVTTYSSYKHPENFYHEELGDTSLYYTNTISIDSLENAWIELSTNSTEEADIWAKKSSHNNSTLWSFKETERYFEFFQNVRLIKFRTHRHAYFTRGDLDFLAPPSGVLGSFNKKNFTGEAAKELIDYLWYVRHYNNASSKILSSFVEDRFLFIVVTHYELHISYGDWDLHDEITLLKKEYSINRASKLITVNETEIRAINGKLN